MTQRSFIFCDICNPQAVRMVEGRRGAHRARDGRRNSDGRMWFEGSDEDARSYGWLATEDGRHVCPDCVERLRSMRDVLEDRLLSPIAVAELLAH